MTRILITFVILIGNYRRRNCRRIEIDWRIEIERDEQSARTNITAGLYLDIDVLNRHRDLDFGFVSSIRRRKSVYYLRLINAIRSTTFIAIRGGRVRIIIFFSGLIKIANPIPIGDGIPRDRGGRGQHLDGW